MVYATNSAEDLQVGHLVGQAPSCCPEPCDLLPQLDQVGYFSLQLVKLYGMAKALVTGAGNA